MPVPEKQHHQVTDLRMAWRAEFPNDEVPARFKDTINLGEPFALQIVGQVMEHDAAQEYHASGGYPKTCTKLCASPEFSRDQQTVDLLCGRRGPSPV